MKYVIYFYRFIAFFIDFIIIALPSIIIYYFHNDFGGMSLSIYEIMLMLYFFYTTISFIVAESTVGLKVLGLTITDVKQRKWFKMRLVIRNIILNLHILYFIWIRFPEAFYILIPAIITPFSKPQSDKKMMLWDYLSGVYIEQKSK